MSLSYSAIWDDTVAMARANSSLIAGIAGVFIFFPSLLFAYFIPDPTGQSLQALSDYFSANIHWIFLSELVSMIGTVAILLLLFGRGTVTVGAAIAGATTILPFYLLASMLSGAIMFGGFLLFVLPMFYLVGRLAVVGPVVVAEGRRNPIDAIIRSFALTRGHGWSIFGIVALVALAGAIVVLVTTAVFGSLFLLAAGSDLGQFLATIVSSAVTSAFSVVMTVLATALYRRLEGTSRTTASLFE